MLKYNFYILHFNKCFTFYCKVLPTFLYKKPWLLVIHKLKLKSCCSFYIGWYINIKTHPLHSFCWKIEACEAISHWQTGTHCFLLSTGTERMRVRKKQTDNTERIQQIDGHEGRRIDLTSCQTLSVHPRWPGERRSTATGTHAHTHFKHTARLLVLTPLTLSFHSSGDKLYF